MNPTAGIAAEAGFDKHPTICYNVNMSRLLLCLAILHVGVEIRAETSSTNLPSGEVTVGPRPRLIRTTSSISHDLHQDVLFLRKCPMPRYPEEARRARYHGTVVLGISIGPRGSFTQVLIAKSSGYPVLDESAREAVSEWQLAPYRGLDLDAGRIRNLQLDRRPSRSGHEQQIRFTFAISDSDNAPAIEKRSARPAGLLEGLQFELHDAIDQRDSKLVESILRKTPERLKPYVLEGWANGYGPLRWAVHNDDLQTTHVLLSHGASVNNRDNFGNSALCSAAAGGNAAMARLLMKYGAKVNVSESSYSSPLYFATMCGHVRMIELLLDAGADIDPVGNNGTPLRFAVQEGRRDVVALLLKRGANPNTRLDTPVVFCGLHDVRMLEMLLRYKVDVNATDSFGKTPLHYMYGDRSFVRILLAHGADPNIKDNQGETPVQLAWEGGYPDIAALLFRHCSPRPALSTRAEQPIGAITINGRSYSNVTWGTSTPVSVFMFHSAGVESVELSKLAPNLRNQFKSNPIQSEGCRSSQRKEREVTEPALSCLETRQLFEQAIGIQDTMSFESEVAFDHPTGPSSRYDQLCALQKVACSNYQEALALCIEACAQAIAFHKQRETERDAYPYYGRLRHDEKRGGGAKPDAQADCTGYDLLQQHSERAWAEGGRLKRKVDASTISKDGETSQSRLSPGAAR